MGGAPNPLHPGSYRPHYTFVPAIDTASLRWKLHPMALMRPRNFMARSTGHPAGVMMLHWPHTNCLLTISGVFEAEIAQDSIVTHWITGTRLRNLGWSDHFSKACVSLSQVSPPFLSFAHRLPGWQVPQRPPSVRHYGVLQCPRHTHLCRPLLPYD